MVFLWSVAQSVSKGCQSANHLVGVNPVRTALLSHADDRRLLGKLRAPTVLSSGGIGCLEGLPDAYIEPGGW